MTVQLSLRGRIIDVSMLNGSCIFVSELLLIDNSISDLDDEHIHPCLYSSWY